MTVQDSWRWCKRCEGLVYSGSGRMGACPEGVNLGPNTFSAGNHILEMNANFVLIMDTESAIGQRDWKYCYKCQGLAYHLPAAGHNEKPCPAGELHDFGGSANYTLMVNRPNAGQVSWKWCEKCGGLAYHLPEAGHPAKKCPAGGLHDFGRSANMTLMTYGQEDVRPPIH